MQAEGQVVAGTHTPDFTSLTVARAASLWVERAELNKRDRGTIKGYRELRDRRIVPLIGTEKLSRLSTPDVVAFRDALLQTRSPAMTRKAVRALPMILNVAMERGKVTQNVAAAVKVEVSARDRKAKIVIPAKAHLRALVEAADGLDTIDPRLPILVRVAMFAGLRSSELRALTWTDIDLVDGTIERFLAVEIAAGLVLDTGKVDGDGNPTLKARYGLHRMRHSAASAWIKQGIDLKRLQVWIGHATIQLTIDTYGHLITDAKADAALAGEAEAALLA